jgi:hypothetical protein
MLNTNALHMPPDSDGQKNGKGQFRKGTSGNPAGRPRGSRNKTTLMMEQLLEDHGEELLQKEIALAREGDRYARRFCLDRLFPTSKERPIELDLPPVENFQHISTVLSSVLQAVATGQITPLEGIQVASLLHLHHDVLKHADVESRIQLLEQVLDPELEAAREQDTQRKVMRAYQISHDALRREKLAKGASNEPSKVEGPSGSTGGPGREATAQKSGYASPHP